jgi:hypothetical protein
MLKSTPWAHILKAETELNWRWGQCESELGFSSTWESIVNQAQGVSYFDPWALNRAEQAIESTARLRRVDKALNSLPKAYSIALYGTYGGHRYPPEIVKRFGKHAACAIMVQKCGLKVLQRLCRIKGFSDSEYVTIHSISNQARNLYTEAHLAFLKAMRQIERNENTRKTTQKENNNER